MFTASNLRLTSAGQQGALTTASSSELAFSSFKVFELFFSTIFKVIVFHVSVFVFFLQS